MLERAWCDTAAQLCSTSFTIPLHSADLDRTAQQRGGRESSGGEGRKCLGAFFSELLKRTVLGYKWVSLSRCEPMAQ